MRCRASRSPSPWRSPTSSTRWWASGPSTRSRPAPRTLMRCAAPRSASSASCWRTACGCRSSRRFRAQLPGDEQEVRTKSQRESPRLLRRPLKVYLRDQGARHDLVDAVFALGGDDLLMIVAPRRGARPLPRHRGRRESAHRHQARHQHPAHRGEEGRPQLRPGARSRTARTAGGKGARQSRRRGREGRGRGRRQRGFRGRHGRHGKLRAPVDAFFDTSPSTPTIRSCARTVCGC